MKPLLQPYHVTPAASLAFGKSSLPFRARRQLGALSVFARPRLSFLDALDHQAGKLSDRSHRHSPKSFRLRFVQCSKKSTEPDDGSDKIFDERDKAYV